jgi:hypothetical protein
MKDTISYSPLMFLVLFLCGFTGKAQTTSFTEQLKKKPSIMKTYVIEREIPGLGQWTPEQLKSASQTSCNVLKELGSKIEWLHSYVTGNKMYCIYRAENPELVKEHAKKGGFPANSISEVTEIIGPATATGSAAATAN